MSTLLSSELMVAVVDWRRHLHRHPELAFQEHDTADFIASLLEQFGLEVHRGLAGTGVVGTLRRGSSMRAIAIRADMDGLPIQEESGLSHASQIPGVMHACGHDGHVAIALAAARLAANLPHLEGTVHFIFQPAEENEGGAKRMIEEGLFRLFPCDAIYALHNYPALPLGHCLVRDGAMMAAFAIFEITITGLGCHGAMPHEGTDAILAASQLVCALHTITGRSVNPVDSAVVSATQIHAGETWNVIPATCTIKGTTRWFDARVGDILEQRLAELSDSVAQAFGCTARVRYERRYPATLNHPVAAQAARAAISRVRGGLTLVEGTPTMGAEDFAFLLEKVPGCYLLLGAGAPVGTHGLHSSRYDFNDDLLPLGAALWTTLITQELAPSAPVNPMSSQETCT